MQTCQLHQAERQADIEMPVNLNPAPRSMQNHSQHRGEDPGGVSKHLHTCEAAVWCVNPTNLPLLQARICACAGADLSGAGGPNPTRLKAAGAVPSSTVPAGSTAGWHLLWLPALQRLGEASSASWEQLPHRSPKPLTPADNAGFDRGKANKPSWLAFCCHSLPFRSNRPTWGGIGKQW